MHCLIHRMRKDFEFTDKVDNQHVYRYTCTKCNEMWLATRRLSWFRIFLAPRDLQKKTCIHCDFVLAEAFKELEAKLLAEEISYELYLDSLTSCQRFKLWLKKTFKIY